MTATQDEIRRWAAKGAGAPDMVIDASRLAELNHLAAVVRDEEPPDPDHVVAAVVALEEVTRWQLARVGFVGDAGGWRLMGDRMVIDDRSIPEPASWILDAVCRMEEAAGIRLMIADDAYYVLPWPPDS